MAKLKYDKDFPIRAEGLARQGLLNRQIGEKLGISETTFYEYQKIFPKFLRAIKKGRTPRKIKPGRPSKYPTIDLTKVEYYGSLGLMDAEIALLLRISERSLNYYKKKTEFLQSIKKGKTEADLKVIDSFYKRGCGFEYEEIRSEYDIRQTDGQEKAFPSKVIKTKKFMPADTAAGFIWLKNRRPWEWRDRHEVGIGFPNEDGILKNELKITVVHVGLKPKEVKPE